MTSGNESPDISAREIEENSSSQPEGTSTDQAETLSVVKKGRGIRKPSKKPKGVWQVEAIDDRTGAPTEPEKTEKKFRTMCGAVVRERVPIDLEDWTKVTKEQRKAKVLEIMKHFRVPEQWKRQVEECALSKAKDAFRNFKYVLHKKFMKQNKDPFEKYPHILPEQWARFVEIRRTPDFQAKSEAGKALIAKNKHPHRMGVKGYYGKRKIWDREDENRRLWGADVPFPDVAADRARDFLRARSTTDSSGQVVLPNPADQEVYQSMVRATTSFSRRSIITTMHAYVRTNYRFLFAGTAKRPGFARLVSASRVQ